MLENDGTKGYTSIVETTLLYDCEVHAILEQSEILNRNYSIRS